MGRKLRSTLPLATEKLTPKWPDTDQLRKTELTYKQQQPENYNRRHRVSTLPELEPTDKVWVPDNSSSVVIVRKSSEPRSYVVKRRSRKHLLASPNKMIRSESRNDSPAKEAWDKDPQEPPNCAVRSGRMVISPT